MKKCLLIAALLITTATYSQTVKPLTRMARITIDSTKIASYMHMLKEQMEAAIRLEPGVLSYAVYTDRSDPAKLTIIEKYANDKAYLSHRETAHFKKYKEASRNIVLQLELSEVDMPLMVERKTKARF